MSSRERDVDETTRDDQADPSSAAARTRTIDRSRRADELVDDEDPVEATSGRPSDDELPTELVPAIDPLLPPVPRVHGNGDAAVEDVAVEDVATVDEDVSLAEPTTEVTEPAARVAESTRGPLPSPETQPSPVIPVSPGYAADVSAPIPVITRRATVVGAERHLVAPVHRAIGRRPRVRKVTRVVRHVDPWTVFKVAAVFSIVVYGVLLTAGVLLWNVAYTTGTVDNVERFFESFGWTEFEFNGGQIYHSAWIAGLFGAVALTGFAVLGATLFNLITDLVGGVRFTVLEEEVVEKTASPMRRFTVRRTETDPTPSG